MRKTIILLLCLAVHLMARGQTNTIDYRYWFDEESDAVTTGQFSGSDFHLDIPTDGLDDRLHYLHFQVCDTAGVWGAPITRQFQKMTSNPDAPIFYHIWHSEDIDNTISGTYTGDTLHLDVSQLSEGPHHVYVQASQNGRYSAPIEKVFYVLPNMETMDYLFCMMNIDGEPYRLERVPMSGGVISWVLDLDSLATGIHRYTIMAITPTGAATSIKEGFFVRDNMASQLAHQRCCYQVDGGEAVIINGSLTNGQYHFDLDMSDISNGLHKLSYWLLSDNGTTTEVRTSLFIKIPLGGTGVKAYDYWLNEDFDNRHSTTLAKQQDPFKLISLLPVETVPLRSCNFKFAFKNDTPVTYARNEFHIRFLDAGGRYVETTKEFVDEKVWEEVTPVGELQPTQTFDRVEENGIRWYTLEAEIGDTVSFMSDQACTLQLFSPSGEEVYTASGNTSVAFGGCHTREDGTYYLAVHDVTGSGATQTLKYQHLAKYAVLSYTPDVVGNAAGNSFKMHLVGNGFDKLTHAVLSRSSSTPIVGEVEDAITSQATIRFVIDGNNHAMGAHDLTLYYLDDDEADSLVIVEAVLFEEPDYGDIVVTRTGGPATSSPFIVSIKVTNKGNMGYSYVPFNIAWDNPHAVRRVAFKNFYASMAAEMDSLGYSLVSATTNLLNKRVEGAMMFFYIPQLNPHETKEYQLQVSMNNGTFNLYAWTGTPVELDTINGAHHIRDGMRKGHTNYSNRGQNMLDFGDAMENVTGMDGMPDVVSNAGRTGNAAIKTGVAIGSGINATGRRIGDEWIDAYGLSGEDADFIRDAYDHLYPEVLTPGSIIGGPLGDLVDGLLGCQDDAAQNPTPYPGNPHHTGRYVPVDPNDIHGYVAESGSQAVKKGLTDGYYVIEFENDPTVATSAAHTIVLRDTLDASVLDLSTFKPTLIKLGDVETVLDENTVFPITIDLRPRLYVIAQVDLDYDAVKGIVTCTITSLDPMMMEPSDDFERGVLPINYSGEGQGELAFDIQFKPSMAHGTEITNRAAIIFDTEEPILTPTWMNVVDMVAPTSEVTSCAIQGTEATIEWTGDDNGSGVWKYDLFMQAKPNGEWTPVAENVDSTNCTIQLPIADVAYGFCVLATDSAGNVEEKVLVNELMPAGRNIGDANCDGSVNVTDVMTVVSQIMGLPVDNYCQENADTNDDGDVNITDVMEIVNIILGAPRTDAPHNARVATNEQLQISASGKRCSLRLEGDEHYTGCQLLVRLPEKCVLRSIATGGQKDATVEYRDLGHGLYSVLTYSPDGTELPTNDLPLLDLIIDGDYARGLEVSGLQLTNRQLETVVLDGSAASPTGIFTINMDSPSSRTYNTRGVEVETPTRGVYIQQGKKVVVH